jgi:CRP/FNR family transcriptional regulator, cyclic AMP receptor protein
MSEAGAPGGYFDTDECETHHIQDADCSSKLNNKYTFQWGIWVLSGTRRATRRRRAGETTEDTGNIQDSAMAGTPMLEDQPRSKQTIRSSPLGCAACSNRRPGWFCSLGSAVLADLELATSTISLPAQASLFTQGEDARCLYLICSGYLKLTAGPSDDRHMIVRVAGPGSMLGLYAVLSHGVYEVSAESLTPAQLRPVERERFLAFLRSHKEAQLRAVQCICQEYRFALQDACRIALAETVAARLARLLIELAHQIGEQSDAGEFRFPLLLTHEEMASMTCTTRETVTRTLGQFRKDGWISIEDSMVTLHDPDRLESIV